MNNRIDIGKLICVKLRDDCRSISWLAKKLNQDKSNLAKILKKESINTQLLFEISAVLEFDFFSYYCKELPTFPFHTINENSKTQ